MRYARMVLLCLALRPLAAASQVVRGEVLEAGSGAPVAGAMVVLVDAGGEPVRRVLTGADGAFIMEAPHPGSFRLRVDRIGYASVTTDPLDVPPAGVHRTVEVPLRPVELAGLDVAGARRCEVRPEEGRVTAQVWEEARKALQAAAWTQESGVYRYTLLHYVRDLDRNGERIESEERTFMEGSTVAPFVSLPADTLAHRGYVFPESDTVTIFHAPDAQAFLSDAFLDTHCLGVRRGEGGLIGLTFAPIEGRLLPDIEGVLWLDEHTALLRRLEFMYVNMRESRDVGDASGEVVFTALPNGTWIVREFRIRMPTRGRRGGRMIRVGYRDEGGIAWRIIDGGSGEIVLEATTATVSGTVVDSAGAPPDPPALVHVPALGDRRWTAPDGSFLLPTLPAGQLTLELRHPSLDTLGLPAPSADVVAVMGEIVPVALELPPVSEVLARACGGADRPSGTGIVFGRVVGPGGAPAADVTVRVLWLGASGFSTTALAAPPGPAGEADLAWTQGFVGAYHALETTTDDRGIFMLCDVPGSSALRVEAARAGTRGAVRRLRIPRRTEVSIVTLTINPNPS